MFGAGQQACGTTTVSFRFRRHVTRTEPCGAGGVFIECLEEEEEEVAGGKGNAQGSN